MQGGQEQQSSPGSQDQQPRSALGDGLRQKLDRARAFFGKFARGRNEQKGSNAADEQAGPNFRATVREKVVQGRATAEHFTQQAREATRQGAEHVGEAVHDRYTGPDAGKNVRNDVATVTAVALAIRGITRVVQSLRETAQHKEQRERDAAREAETVSPDGTNGSRPPVTKIVDQGE